VLNDFSTLPDDAEGSDQEHDMTYDQDDRDADQDTADGGAQEDSGLTLSTPLPPLPLPSCRIRVTFSTTSGEQ
jgi:hypothetical protein